MASSTGLWRLNTVSSPLTHSASLRLLAPAGPPLTGESSIATPFVAKLSCRRRTTVGELVERSNHAVPRRMPASSPSSASATCSTSRGPGRAGGSWGMERLAMLLDEGKGGPEDYEGAAQWLLEAARQGKASSIEYLRGDMSKWNRLTR